MNIKPIQTRYSGCHFRSRLEARWAVFFDHLGIEWQYEPEGFDLPSGGYLPDFYLPGVYAREYHPDNKGVWFEVKPYPDHDDRHEEMVQATGKFLYVGHSMPAPGDMPPEWIHEYNPYDVEMGSTSTPGSSSSDEWMAPCCCDGPGETFIMQHVRYGRHQIIGKMGDSNFDLWACYQPVYYAVVAARSARFEHGQTGPS